MANRTSCESTKEAEIKHQLITYSSNTSGWIAAVSSDHNNGWGWGWETVYSGETEEQAVAIAMSLDSRSDKLSRINNSINVETAHEDDQGT